MRDLPVHRDVRHPEPEGPVRHAQGSFLLSGHNRHVRRHARFELQVFVVDRDHDVVRHDVLHADRRVPHLRDGPVEKVFRVSIHAEAGSLSFSHAADIGLADIGVHLHLHQVLRDDKEGGGLEAGHDGLTDVHGAGDHNAVYRRVDGGIAEIQFGGGEGRLRLVQLGLHHLHVGFGVAIVCFSQIEIRLRDEGLLPESGYPVALTLSLGSHVSGLGQIAGGALHGGPRLVDA